MSDDVVDDAPASAIDELEELSPIAPLVIAVALTSIKSLWKRIERRAPEAIRARVLAAFAMAEDQDQRAASPEGEVVSVADRLALAKALEDLGAELRGRKPWEATFYREGRLGIVRAQDPIKIQGAVDHRRLEEFFERYVRRAELAFERLEYFFRRAGVADPKDKAAKKPWDQPYLSFDTYRELIWGKIQRKDRHVRRE